MQRIKSKVLYISVGVFFLFIIPLLIFISFSKSAKGSLEIDKEVNIPFIREHKPNVILFFGYYGCADVCTPILESLSMMYNSDNFASIKESTDIIFVNLTPEVEEFQPQLFAQYFHESFIGVYLTKVELQQIDRAFGVFYSKSLTEQNGLNHTDHIYYITNSEKQILKNIYPSHPLNRKKLIDDIIEIERMKRGQ